MLSYEEIKKYCTNYKIENGIVIEKSSNMPVTDEDTILKVKSSYLILLNAHKIHEDDLHMNRKETQSQEVCILKSMKQYSVHNEKIAYGTNLFINDLLNSNGHYEADISGTNINEGKYSLLSDQKRDLGIAYLKLKFREKGLDIDNLRIGFQEYKSQSGKSTGQYRIIVDFDIKKYEKSTITTVEENTQRYVHPMAKELNELEKTKQNARANNDIEAYKKAQADIEQIIRYNPATVSPEKWDTMSIDEQISYVQVKMNESKILNDQDAYDYWNTNLTNLQNKRKEKQSVPPTQETPISNNQTSTNKKGSNDYYSQLLSVIKRRRTATNLTEEEQKQIIGEIYYNMSYMVEYANTNEEIMDLISKVLNDLNAAIDFERQIQNQIIADFLEKLNKQKKENTSESTKEEPAPVEKPNISNNIEQIKNSLRKLQNEYESMLSDHRIDDDELSILIRRMNELLNDAEILKTLVTTSKERQILNIVIDNIAEEKKKMKKMLYQVEEAARGSR